MALLDTPKSKSIAAILVTVAVQGVPAVSCRSGPWPDDQR